MRVVRPLSFALAVAVVACGGNKGPEQPKPDQSAAAKASADSAARAQAARDSAARAQAAADAARRKEAEEMAARRAAEERAARAARDTKPAEDDAATVTRQMREAIAVVNHYDYDKSDLMPEDMANLDLKAAILKANPSLKIKVGGHCDERGSDEYNFALGNRRAAAAKRYLVGKGVEAGRIETVSYGRERPADPGHDEAAFAKNRRGEYEITAGGDALVKPK